MLLHSSSQPLITRRHRTLIDLRRKFPQRAPDHLEPRLALSRHPSSRAPSSSPTPVARAHTPPRSRASRAFSSAHASRAPLSLSATPRARLTPRPSLASTASTDRRDANESSASTVHARAPDRPIARARTSPSFGSGRTPGSPFVRSFDRSSSSSPAARVSHRGRPPSDRSRAASSRGAVDGRRARAGRVDGPDPLATGRDRSIIRDPRPRGQAGGMDGPTADGVRTGLPTIRVSDRSIDRETSHAATRRPRPIRQTVGRVDRSRSRCRSIDRSVSSGTHGIDATDRTRPIEAIEARRSTDRPNPTKPDPARPDARAVSRNQSNFVPVTRPVGTGDRAARATTTRPTRGFDRSSRSLDARSFVRSFVRSASRAERRFDRRRHASNPSSHRPSTFVLSGGGRRRDERERARTEDDERRDADDEDADDDGRAR